MKSRKPLSLPRHFLLTCALAICPFTVASSADTPWFWNAGGVGGDGIWGTGPGEKNWNAVAGAPAGNIAWPDGNSEIAVFQDPTGGTITVFDSVLTHGIRQDGANYRIEAGGIQLSANPAANTPFVDVRSGTLTLATPVSGSHGLLKIGGGLLVLSASNPYTGTTTLAEGSLRLTGSLASAGIQISSGASLEVTQSGLREYTAVSNAGSLRFDLTDTIASYTSPGGTLAAGPGTLFTGSATLQDNSSVAGLLNTNSLTSNGTVLVSGQITAQSAAVQSGTLTLSGSLSSPTLSLATGASLLNSAGGFSADMALTNAGSLTLSANDTITSYSSLGGTLANGAGTLFTGSATLQNNSSVAGLLNTNSLTSNGTVLVSGQITAQSAAVQSGTLTLSGSLSSPTLSLATGASLLNSSGGFSPDMALTNAGSLTLSANDTITSYSSLGGTLANGARTLFTSSASLQNNSTVAGLLNTNSLTSNGAVHISGNVHATTLELQSGTLHHTGTLGANSPIQLFAISSAARFIAAGTHHYNTLTTVGPAAAFWQGDLIHSTLLQPGGNGQAGHLAISGDWTQTAAGKLAMDLSSSGTDLLEVGGNANLGGTLDLRQGPGLPIQPFVPVTILQAGGYMGNIATLQENLPGAVWFNPANGTVTRLADPTASANPLFGADENQSAVWVSLYDDVIDPGIENIRHLPGNPVPWQIDSGLADPSRPDLLWTLAASFTPAGLDGRLLDHLSPQTYSAFSDHATLATRQQQRAARSAPAIARTASVAPSTQSTTRSDTPGLDWIASLGTFHAGTGHSVNGADYDLSGTDFLFGMRGQPKDFLRLTAYLAGHDGRLDGPMLDAEASGVSFGLIAEWWVDPKRSTSLTAGISYGDYSYDGTRLSAAAGPAGWVPAGIDFSNVGHDALELLLGIETLSYADDRFRILPSAELRYSSGTMSRFQEIPNAAGPIGLALAADRHESMLLELALRAETDLSPELRLRGQFGANLGLIEQDHLFQARFLDGNRPMRVRSEGLGQDLLFLDLSSEYRFHPLGSVGLGYRVEFRPSHPALQAVTLSTVYRF